MAAGEKTSQHIVDHIVLTHDHFADLLKNVLARFADALDEADRFLRIGLGGFHAAINGFGCHQTSAIFMGAETMPPRRQWVIPAANQGVYETDAALASSSNIRRPKGDHSMPEQSRDPSHGSSEPEARSVWERIALWWDSAIGEGNEFQRELIMPATDRLLAARPGDAVLDAACGNGNYSRRLARAGARVVAFDGSPTFIERARSRAKPEDGDIEYLVLDATDESALLSLGESRFDAAVCSMAMMDLPAISPLLCAVRRLLKPGGRFVFSIPHPCFNSSRSRMTAELVEDRGKFSQIHGVHVIEYLRPTAELSSGIINQPEPHYLFHRPMSLLLAECVAAGFVLDGMEEPAFAPGTSAKSAFSWAKRPQIPPAMVVRLR
jgi:2-polyprenyl-3-methyl-5-hydroxy-6-metoxy-1,4-benzoquinol methylase